MREEYDFESDGALEALGISMDEYLNCAKIVDKLMESTSNFYKFTQGIENLIKSGDNPVLMRFMAMIVAQKVKEVHSIDRTRVLDPSISGNKLKEVIQTLVDVVESEYESDDFDENIIKKG